MLQPHPPAPPAQHGESNAGSTGTHAALLAPHHVTLWRHTDGTSHHRRTEPLELELPDFDPATTVVLFPSPGADVLGSPSCPPFTRAVVIEGSWRKATGLLQRHPKLQAMRRVALPPDTRTVFWRRGEGTFRCVCACVRVVDRGLGGSGFGVWGCGVGF